MYYIYIHVFLKASNVFLEVHHTDLEILNSKDCLAISKSKGRLVLKTFDWNKNE